MPVDLYSCFQIHFFNVDSGRSLLLKELKSKHLGSPWFIQFQMKLIEQEDVKRENSNIENTE